MLMNIYTHFQLNISTLNSMNNKLIMHELFITLAAVQHHREAFEPTLSGSKLNRKNILE